MRFLLRSAAYRLIVKKAVLVSASFAGVRVPGALCLLNRTNRLQLSRVEKSIERSA
jgi:hypothetical protein